MHISETMIGCTQVYHQQRCRCSTWKTSSDELLTIITSAGCDLHVKSKELKPKAKLGQFSKNFFTFMVT